MLVTMLYRSRHKTLNTSPHLSKDRVQLVSDASNTRYNYGTHRMYIVVFYSGIHAKLYTWEKNIDFKYHFLLVSFLYTCLFKDGTSFFFCLLCFIC